MKSKVIKFVAGAGKTTYSKKLMLRVNNGLYLAFTNSVINDMNKQPIIAKTIDSLFSSYIIPKFIELIPLINNNSKIKFLEDTDSYLNKQAGNINICQDGTLYNKGKKIDNVTLLSTNNELHNCAKFPNSEVLKYIFGRDVTWISHKHRGQIANFLINMYPEKLVSIIEKRFSYIVIDEAQDLSDHKENFCRLLFESGLKIRILGDDNQNINGGGKWFEQLTPDKVQSKTYRCSEQLCQWIRENLAIEIIGTHINGIFESISSDQVASLDDGKRYLLYNSRAGSYKDIIKDWNGPKDTIKTAKGSTINADVVIVGKSLNDKNYYTAITRTTKNVYSTIK